MTGFGRAEGSCSNTGWTWEIRAVNGKGLDVRLKLPNGMERLEPLARKLCTAKLSRGNIQVSLTARSTKGGAVPTVNDAALQQVLNHLVEIERDSAVQLSTGAQILGLRGVMELAEPKMSDEESAALEQDVLAGLTVALDALNDHRGNEGSALGEVLLGHLTTVEKLTALAEADPARSSEAIAEKLQAQLTQLGELAAGIDRDRLYQEVALMVTKADIREELDRLAAHTIAARELISMGSPIGRKLEFLAQEFNRESNTLCSKSNSVSLTEIGLELKVVIDQFREQILNVE